MTHFYIITKSIDETIFYFKVLLKYTKPILNIYLRMKFRLETLTIIKKNVTGI